MKKIYSLKQALWTCYHELKTFLVNFGFANAHADTLLFVQGHDVSTRYISLFMLMI